MPLADEQLKCEQLGLRDWQTLPEAERIYSHIGWFDRRGFAVGCGDVSATDLKHISDRLPEGEVLVLGQPASMPPLVGAIATHVPDFDLMRTCRLESGSGG